MSLEAEILEKIQALETRVSEIEIQEHMHRLINLGENVELTISSGAVTRTQTYHSIDTEGDAATDDLDTVNGGTAGDILILRSVDSARDVVVRDMAGNLQLAGDFTLGQGADRIVLIYDGILWYELSRSNN